MNLYCNHCMTKLAEETEKCPYCGKDTKIMVPAHHLLPGTILNGKFYVGEALGEGGFGITYIGRDTRLDMKVAIKEFYPNGYVNRSNTISPQINNSVTDDRRIFFENGRERFLREAQILAKFSTEPGIVEVRDFFEENNTAYIIMEYLDGVTLKTYLKNNGNLSPEQTIQLLMPVMNSLKKVHAEGLIHRDISPDNIMIIGNKVKLLDFGAARNVSAIANKSLSVMLKPGFAPEEQYRSKGNQGPWTDVYALCATMYKCITGITPDDATQRVFSDEVKTPSALNITIRPEIEKAIMKGMSVQHKDRYQSIEDLIKGLQGINVPSGESEQTIAAVSNRNSDDSATVFIPNTSNNINSSNNVGYYSSNNNVTLNSSTMAQNNMETGYAANNIPNPIVMPQGNGGTGYSANNTSNPIVMSQGNVGTGYIANNNYAQNTVAGPQSSNVMEYAQNNAQNSASMVQSNMGAGTAINNNTNDNGKQNKKKMRSIIIVVAVVAAAIIIALIVLVVLLFNKNKKQDTTSKEDSTNTQVIEDIKDDDLGDKADENTDDEDENIGNEEDGVDEVIITDTDEDEVIEMSDNLFDFTFILDGVVYQLPCEFEDFTDNGWTISGYVGYSSESKINGDSYENVKMSKDGKSIYVDIYNFSGNAKAIKECKIGGIEVDGKYGPDDFEIACGITVKSSVDEIKETFGIPGDSYSADEYESLTYYATKNSYYNSVKFVCQTGEMSDYSEIYLKNFVETDSDETVSNYERPEYLDEYVAPAKMSEDITLPLIKIEGDIYSLPCPVSEFIDNGWEIIEQSGDLAAGQKDYITVKKYEKELTLYIVNYAEYQTSVDNCAVYSVGAYDDSDIDIAIGSGDSEISFSTTKKEVDEIVDGIYDSSESTYSYSYSYYGAWSVCDLNIYIYVSKETKKVNLIKVYCNTWGYGM